MIERPYENLLCDECKNRFGLDDEERCSKISAFNSCYAMCAQVLECKHFEKEDKVTNQRKKKGNNENK